MNESFYVIPTCSSMFLLIFQYALKLSRVLWFLFFFCFNRCGIPFSGNKLWTFSYFRNNRVEVLQFFQPLSHKRGIAQWRGLHFVMHNGTEVL